MSDPALIPSGEPRPTDVCVCSDYRAQHNGDGCWACPKGGAAAALPPPCHGFRLAPLGWQVGETEHHYRKLMERAHA